MKAQVNFDSLGGGNTPIKLKSADVYFTGVHSFRTIDTSISIIESDEYDVSDVNTINLYYASNGSDDSYSQNYVYFYRVIDGVETRINGFGTTVQSVTIDVTGKSSFKLVSKKLNGTWVGYRNLFASIDVP